jgi:hypothetical protein
MPIVTSLETVAWVLTDFVHSSFNSASHGFCLLPPAIVLLLRLLLNYGYGCGGSRDGGERLEFEWICRCDGGKEDGAVATVTRGEATGTRKTKWWLQ